MTAGEMKTAALALLDALPEEERALVHLPFDDPRREVWMYWPREMSGDIYPGVGLHRMTMEQRKRVLRLVATGVEWETLAQVAAVMALDIPLDASEQYTRTSLRDPLRYWVAVFGDPDDEGTWSWQFEGHHVAINHVIVARPCGPEEDAGRALLRSLPGDVRAQAVLDAPAPIDFVVHRLPEVPPVTRPGEYVHPLGAFQHLFVSLEESAKEALTLDLASPAGVARADLASGQQALLDDLIGLYVGRLPAPLAAAELGRLEAAGLDEIHFAWAGPEEPGAPHYYRLHGPTFLVEFDCVQDGANHAHAVWRDPARDFGRDPLRLHRATAH